MKRLIPIIATLSVAVITVLILTFCVLAKSNAKPKANEINESGWANHLFLMKKAANEGSKTEKTEPQTTVAKETEPATQPTTQAPTEAPAEKKAEPQTDEERVIEAARAAVANCTNSGMTKEQKLKAAFDYLKNNYLEGSVRDTYTGSDWATVYAKDMLIYGKGDCFSFGASFAYMAKAIGYDEAYACSSGGHGWAEVNGKVYDPEWSLHNSKYSYYGMSYDEPCDVNYSCIKGGADWMHVKV